MTCAADRPVAKRLRIGLIACALMTPLVWMTGCDIGCDDFYICPLPEPIARATLPEDLTGTWRASLQHDELVPWSSAQLPPLVSDSFFHFDSSGELEYLGLIAPGGTVGVWLVDFGANQASKAFHIVRSGVSLTHADEINGLVLDRSQGLDPNDPNTPGTTVAHAIRADQGFGVVGFDLRGTIDDIRIDPTGQLMTGQLSQTEQDLASPAPAHESYGGTIWLDRVSLDIQEPSGLIEVGCTMASRNGGQIPHSVGTVFDLDATGTTGPSGLTYKWTIQRTVTDGFGRFVGSAMISAADGQTSSFTADAAGTYVVRCWTTDGVQWATGPPLVTRVE